MTSRLQSFETEILAEDEDFAGLSAVNSELIAKAEAVDSPQRVVLDMDSTEIPVYGQQEQSTYNGHFESTCYHPLLLFNRDGDCLASKLRPGNAHSADDWGELLLPEIERQQKLGKGVVFRAQPVGRPSHKPVISYKSFLYQAERWKTARRVVAKVEFHAGKQTGRRKGVDGSVSEKLLEMRPLLDRRSPSG